MASVHSEGPLLQHRRPSPGVIDVDSLYSDEISYLGFRSSRGAPIQRLDATDGTAAQGDPEVLYVGYRRPHHRRPQQPVRANTSDAVAGPSSRSQPIVISDSEDEVLEVISGAASRANRRTRMISPPPQPIHPRFAPSGPTAPAQFTGSRPLPPRDPPPPAIRPNPNPFAFEEFLAGPSRRSRSAIVDAPPAAAHSHHQPVMGLGGALLARNRQMVEADRQRQEDERTRRQLSERGADRWWNLPLAGLFGIGPQQPHAHNDWLDPIDLLDNFLAPIFPANLFGHRSAGVGASNSRATASEPLYKTSYTHPEPPAPGFTHDFAPADATSGSGSGSPEVIVIDDDDDAPAQSGSSAVTGPSHVVEATMTLVCARCLDTLVMSTNSTLSEEERRRRRVWALRCGHMLDGKCVEEIMRPAPPPVPVTEEDPSAVKDKGKEKADAGTDSAPLPVSEQPSPERLGKRKRNKAVEVGTDRKGKRRAIEAEPEGLVPGSFPAFKPEPGQDDNSIRSRLRPRNSRGAQDSVATSSTAELPGARPNRFPGHRHGHSYAAVVRNGSKGKGRARGKPQIEAVHEWKCPVVGCGRVHSSVLIDSEWKMDGERGAIGMFV
ncbi:hypothetical protein WOLCODRAFT_163730 [Wolfiporia cocos MD-104 SS10]|uniref:Uncharacterized protein n=1 Tax=Wolfiporia cocos (strain MD-104) TaxID=742152 RepID=A0A2H3JLG7_WOLCO|nr:hypothetical protein WOLCODRAFT_163730 [Wolfiporia cocos MD-104 SS10]